MTGEIVGACPVDGKRHDPKFTEMSLARREFFAAWRAWVAEHGSPTDISLEFRATAEVMRQLVELEGS